MPTLICVSGLAGPLAFFELDAPFQISDVCARVAEAAGIPEDEQRLFSGAQELSASDIVPGEGQPGEDGRWHLTLLRRHPATALLLRILRRREEAHRRYFANVEGVGFAVKALRECPLHLWADEDTVCAALGLAPSDTLLPIADDLLDQGSPRLQEALIRAGAFHRQPGLGVLVHMLWLDVERETDPQAFDGFLAAAADARSQRSLAAFLAAAKLDEGVPRRVQCCIVSWLPVMDETPPPLSGTGRASPE